MINGMSGSDTKRHCFGSILLLSLKCHADLLSNQHQRFTTMGLHQYDINHGQ